MEHLVTFTPRGDAPKNGYAIKHTALHQTLTLDPDYQDWQVVDTGEHPRIRGTRMWIVFSPDWQGQVLDARYNPDGSDTDPNYQEKMDSYQAEYDADSANLGIFEGTEQTVILRRSVRVISPQ